MALTPHSLEKGVAWFEQNWAKILGSGTKDHWWHYQIREFVCGQRIPLSEFLRILDELGYQKYQNVRFPGDFANRGGIVDIFPIQMRTAVRVEFNGNTMSDIMPLPAVKNTEPETPLKKLIEKRAKDAPAIPSSNLIEGMYVVHIDHGIAKFQGIRNSQILNLNDQPNSKRKVPSTYEYLVLEYAGRDKLYVPRIVADRVAPYLGFGTPIVHRLGGNLWEKTKRKAKEDILKTARELAKIYAHRELAVRPPYEIHSDMHQTLAASFPYEETPDQKRAIEDVMRDMQKEHPMDRLICGDVGFGKTEVAIRAAACAAFSGRQAILLSPTTVLAYQHFRTLTQRFSQFPLNIAMLSRIKDKEDQKRVVRECKEGIVDIVVGTHRILSRDVAFQNLGLLIIDEEQRFGVKQKEKIRQLRAQVDVLSLSATPIPRTLSFTLSGLRDVNIIQTPPAGRIPIKTTVAPRSKKIIREAAERELARSGQIYLLHNRLQTIERAAQEIAEMFPKNRIAIAHAKLPEGELISTMDEFREGKIDILVATTIIENGLDIENVNTLIVDNATRLGLSQAHQIRGRIGRGEVQAYAYLLYPGKKMRGRAKERLEALHAMQFLGAGYHIALKDLEMRGAGNFLGRDQSGTMNKIGMNLYCQMLQEATEEIRTAS